jgi:hypothetical protein
LFSTEGIVVIGLRAFSSVWLADLQFGPFRIAVSHWVIAVHCLGFFGDMLLCFLSVVIVQLPLFLCGHS